jgi:hypothetical protein
MSIFLRTRTQRKFHSKLLLIIVENISRDHQRKVVKVEAIIARDL